VCQCVCASTYVVSSALSSALSLSLYIYIFMCANMWVPLRLWVSSALSSALSENHKFVDEHLSSQCQFLLLRKSSIQTNILVCAE